MFVEAKFKRFLLGLFTAFLPILFTHCGRSSSTETITISGVVSLARVVGATVTASEINYDGSIGSTLGTATTNSVGYWEMEIPKSDDPYVITVTGGRYIDEATLNTVTLGANEAYRVILASASTDREIAITPLTHIAAEAILDQAASGQTLTTGLISDINESVGEALGFDATYDIRVVQPVNPYNSADVAAASNEEQQYALFLAGLSQQANTLGVSQADLIATYVAAFGDDLSFSGTTNWLTGIRDAASVWQAGANNTAGLPSVNFAAKLTDGTVTASSTTTSAVSLSWSGYGSAATSYKVVFAASSTAPASCSAGTSIYTGTATSYSHTGLVPNTAYSYRVCALDGASNITSGSTANATTATFTNGSITDVVSSLSYIELTWSGFSSSAVSYRMVRSAAGSSTAPADCTGTAVYTGSATTYRDTGLASATTYSYRICAVDAAGNHSSGITRTQSTN